MRKVNEKSLLVGNCILAKDNGRIQASGAGFLVAGRRSNYVVAISLDVGEIGRRAIGLRRPPRLHTLELRRRPAAIFDCNGRAHSATVHLSTFRSAVNPSAILDSRNDRRPRRFNTKYPLSVMGQDTRYLEWYLECSKT